MYHHCTCFIRAAPQRSNPTFWKRVRGYHRGSGNGRRNVTNFNDDCTCFIRAAPHASSQRNPAFGRGCVGFTGEGSGNGRRNVLTNFNDTASRDAHTCTCEERLTKSNLMLTKNVTDYIHLALGLLLSLPDSGQLSLPAFAQAHCCQDFNSDQWSCTLAVTLGTLRQSECHEAGRQQEAVGGAHACCRPQFP